MSINSSESAGNSWRAAAAACRLLAGAWAAGRGWGGVNGDETGDHRDNNVLRGEYA